MKKYGLEQMLFKRVIELAEPGDVVILASKGREDYEILKGGKKSLAFRSNYSSR